MRRHHLCMHLAVGNLPQVLTEAVPRLYTGWDGAKGRPILAGW